MMSDTYRWCHGGKGNCLKATTMKKKLKRTGRRIASAQRGWPACRSFPDRMRSEKVSTVGSAAPKTRVWPSRNKSAAFIAFIFSNIWFQAGEALCSSHAPFAPVLVPVASLTNARQLIHLEHSFHNRLRLNLHGTVQRWANIPLGIFPKY